MFTGVLSTERDPMGAALAEFAQSGQAARLRVFSSQFEEDELPVKELFRTRMEMGNLELKALELAKGRILDVGAGSGCHSLVLQQEGKCIEAIDISPRAVDVMKQRGVKCVQLTNLFNEHFVGCYDTILMLMNGSGIVGKLVNLPTFFQRMKLLLAPGGCVYMDSSDLRYLFMEKDGSMVIDLAGDYYGEVDFWMQYRQVKGEHFDWLYVDFQTLTWYAQECGFQAELIAQGAHYDYLAKLSML